MSADLLERAKAAVAAARKRGAQGARAAAVRERESEIEWRDGKLDRLRDSTRLSLHVTLFVDGRFSQSTTSDLRPAAVEKFLDETIAQTRLLAKDPFRALADPASYAGRLTKNLRLRDDQAGSITPDQRRAAVKDLEAAARSAPSSERIISVTTSCSDDLFEGALCCSNGMEGTATRSSFQRFAEVSVRDDGSRKPEGWWYAATRHNRALPPAADIGREATRRAMMQVGAKPQKTGEFACVIENQTAGRLVSALFEAVEGSAVQQKRSFLTGKVGQPIGSSVFSITDDPHVEAGLGSRYYDGEGMATRPRPVFERGVLRGYYLDTYYARKLKLEPTSGTRTNLVWGRGTRDLAGLLKAMGNGILVTGFIGGNSNSATGDFSFGIRGYLVERGQTTRPVTEMNISGNHLVFWKKLLELGSDPFLYSSNRCPSLRFDKVQFSGV
ncbi:MAG: TldD/PmbA family protein [Deltaproteobacteria bacterium]|nr:TldD/PmbA family protein [Deltaproteobacteria bacterium]